MVDVPPLSGRACRGHRVHLRGALSDVCRRARVGWARAHRVRVFVRAADRLARGAERARTAGPNAVHPRGCPGSNRGRPGAGARGAGPPTAPTIPWKERRPAADGPLILLTSRTSWGVVHI